MTILENPHGKKLTEHVNVVYPLTNRLPESLNQPKTVEIYKSRLHDYNMGID